MRSFDWPSCIRMKRWLGPQCPLLNHPAPASVAFRCFYTLVDALRRSLGFSSASSGWQVSALGGSSHFSLFSPLKAEHYFFSAVSGHQPAQQNPSIWTICLLGYCVGNVKSSETLLLRLTYGRGIELNGSHKHQADIYNACQQQETPIRWWNLTIVRQYLGNRSTERYLILTLKKTKAKKCS